MEKILSYEKNTLIRDLFGIMSEVLANRDYPTYEHTIRVAQIAKQIGIDPGTVWVFLHIPPKRYISKIMSYFYWCDEVLLRYRYTLALERL